MKTCSKCKEEKGLGKFGKRTTAKDGLNEWCKECACESSNRYRERNLEKVRKTTREYHRKRRAENPEAYREQRKKWRDANREKRAELRKEKRRENRFETLSEDLRARAKKHSFAPCRATPEELEEIFARGHGRCEVCGVPELELTSRLHLDHCHETGRARGFLCYKCNHALGLLNDNEEVIINLLHYLMASAKQK